MIIELKDMLKAIRSFRDYVTTNHSSSTLYHGLDDLLNGYIPKIFLDNMNDEQLSWYKQVGFMIKKYD